LDNNPELAKFSKTLEQVCIDLVESGKMTKDLALLVYGDKMTEEHYLTTEDFLDAIDSELKKRMA